MTILIALLTLTVLTCFLIGNFNNSMRIRLFKKKKQIKELQKQIHAYELKKKSDDKTLKSQIKDAERRLAQLKKAYEQQ